MTPPAGIQQPRPRRDDRGRVDRKIDHRAVIAPAVEPAGRRAGVERGHLAAVLASVEEHVGQSAANLTWGAKLAAMIAIRPHGPTALAGPIERASGADHQAPHARGERVLVVSLGDEVHVVPLN